jgi:hypothetical protein
MNSSDRSSKEGMAEENFEKPITMLGRRINLMENGKI